MLTQDYSNLFHFSTIALAISSTSLGVGIGEGISCQAALEAINIQPAAKNDIARIAIIGMALVETAALMGVAIATFLWIDSGTSKTIYTGIAEVGIAFAICFSGFVLGLVSALPTQQAVLAVARQPYFSQNIFRFMLITQSIIQTPIIFCFIIAMFIKEQASTVASLTDSVRLISSGICIGIGSIGPAIGLAHFAQTACKSIGINKHAFNKILSFTFISQAIIETPIIFALIVSLLLINSSIVAEDDTLTAVAMLASAICIGFGTIGAGIGSGKTAAAACYQMALHEEKNSILSRMSMLGQGLIDTGAIYALLISLILLFFR